MSEYNLRARWIPFTGLAPAEGDIVLARKIDGKIMGSIYTESDGGYGDPSWVFNGEFYMHQEDLEDWEWLEIKQKGGE